MWITSVEIKARLVSLLEQTWYDLAFHTFMLHWALILIMLIFLGCIHIPQPVQLIPVA